MAADRTKRNILKRHLETKHTECVGKTLEFLHMELNEFSKQKRECAKITTDR
jgi:hypothetical protein